MQGPDTLVDILDPLEKGQAHQWGFGQRKTLRSVCRQESFELLFLLDCRHTLPVVLPPGEFYLPIYDLKRLVVGLPMESSAQYWVPVYNVLPGLLEGRDVQMTGQRAAPLHTIRSWLRGI